MTSYTPNPSPYIDNLTNLTNDTMYKGVDVFSVLIGRDVLFTLIFGLIAVGLFIKFEHNITILVGYLLFVDVFMIATLNPIGILIFGLVTAFLGGGALYDSLIRNR